jgi:hypothetical protein
VVVREKSMPILKGSNGGPLTMADAGVARVSGRCAAAGRQAPIEPERRVATALRHSEHYPIVPGRKHLRRACFLFQHAPELRTSIPVVTSTLLAMTVRADSHRQNSEHGEVGRVGVYRDSSLRHAGSEREAFGKRTK